MRPTPCFHQTHGGVGEHATHIVDRVVALARITDDILNAASDQRASQFFRELAERLRITGKQEYIEGAIRKASVDFERAGAHVMEQRCSRV